MTGYRVEVLEAPEQSELGVCYCLELPEPQAKHYRIRIEPVAFECAAGVRLGVGSHGRSWLYRGDVPYGQTLQGALVLGWCRLQDASETATASVAGMEVAA